MIKFIKNNLGDYVTTDGKYRIVKYKKYWKIWGVHEDLGGTDTLKRAKELVEFQYQIREKKI